MTVKQKALELVKKFIEPTKDGAKQCAIICVDEILNLDIDANTLGYWYWQEVKREIEQL